MSRRLAHLWTARFLIALSLLCCGGLVIAGCGSDDDDDESPATADSGSGSSDFADAIAWGESYTGGTREQASGEPVTVGWINDQGGIVSFPEITAAAEASVKFVNEELGGIDGRPLELDTCFPTTEQQGQKCAQQFLNNADVKFVVAGPIAIGSAAFHRTLRGRKPVLLTLPAAPDDRVAKNAYGLGSGVFSSASDATLLVETLKAKKIGIAYAGDEPAGTFNAKVISQALKAYGIDPTLATYKQSSSDLTSTIAAAGGNDVDALDLLVATPQTCVAAAKAVDQLSITKPVLTIYSCINDQMKKAFGDYPQWTYRWGVENPDAPGASPAALAYPAVMERYGAESGGFAAFGFSGVLAAAKLATTVGADRLEPDAFNAVARKFKGPAPMLPPDLKFGQPGAPALGTLAVRYYDYEGDGKWTDPTDGWVNPPAPK